MSFIDIFNVFSGKGRLFWGICYGDIKKWGEHNVEIPGSSGVILMSAAEDPQLKKAYEDKFEIKSAAGAGNKLLKVAIGKNICFFFIYF